MKTGWKKRNVLSSVRLSELKRKKRKLVQKKIFIYFVILLFILVGMVFLFNWSKLNISTVVVLGNKVVDSEQIEKKVWDKISGNYLYFFPKTSFLLLPKGNIKEELNN